MHVRIFCLLIFAFGVLSACQRAAAPVAVSNRPVSINDVPQKDVPLSTKPLAEMSWTLADGTKQTLKDFAGKAVILDFWATYCEPCRREIPHLNSLIAKYGVENIQVVGLNVGGDEDKPEIPAFVKQTKLDYPIAFPEDELIKFVFAGRDDIPQTIIVDRTGRVVTKIIGFSPRIAADLDEAVAKAVSAQ